MALNNNPHLCPDWVILNNCNVNIAKDRGWFVDYTPFKSNFAPDYFGQKGLAVNGVGAVEIPIKAAPNDSTVKICRLENVLHAPDAICNVLGQPILERFPTVKFGNDGLTKGGLYTETGEKAGYFVRDRPLLVLAIGTPKGKELGPPVIVEGKSYALGFRWPETEVRRWEEHRAANAAKAAKTSQTSLTTAEEAFLKQRWGNWFKFLREHELNIHKETDCEAGRLILRAVMWITM